MNRRTDTDDRSWTAFRVPGAAQRANRLRIVLATSLLTGMGLAGIGQEFRNLNFEQASLVPASGPYTGEVEIGPALPGWSVFTQVPFVLYDNMFLDSAGVSILDTNWGAFQGKFMVVLEGGLSLSWPLQELSVAIAQTGTVPAWANTMLFDGWLMAPVGTDFVVSIAGESLPFYPLAVYTNYTLFGVDVSRFSGRAQELRFTANPHLPPRPAINIAYLDDIHFSSSPLSAPPLITSQPLSQTVSVGSNVVFTVVVAPEVFLTPGYQWFFNGTNAISGATNADLRLANLQLSQSGSYTIVISNIFGAVTSSPATLSVIALPPAITAPPLDQTAATGASAEFMVGAIGSPLLHYQWFFVGIPVGGATSSNLYLANVQPSQAGSYVVTITNAFGAVTSSPVTLTVTGSAVTNRLSGRAVGWGYDYFGQSSALTNLSAAIAVAAGEGHSLALLSDGTVVAWGDNRLGQSAVPSGLRGVVAIAAGASHSVALKSGGTVAGWGDNSQGQSTVPAGLTGVIAIAAGGLHSLALKSDGTVVAWGRNDEGQIVAPGGLQGVTAIAAGTYHSLALKSDGTVVGWGGNSEGQSSVPPSLRGVVAIAAGGVHSLALKRDGTVVGWGFNNVGQVAVPAGLGGVTAIAAGGFAIMGGHSLALKSNGTVVAWGAGMPGKTSSDDHGQATVPLDLQGVIGIAAGGWHSLAITAKPILQSSSINQTAELGSPVTFCAYATGSEPLFYRWVFDGTNVLGDATTNPCSRLAGAEFSQSGTYSVIISNGFGAVTSAPVTLSVIPAMERRWVPGLTLLGQPGSTLTLVTGNLLTPASTWTVLNTQLLTNGSQWHFDLSSPLQAQRFYRAWQTNSSGSPPTLEIHMVPALTLTGAMGSRVRVDAINQFGPTDVWFPLDTVTLTNTSQLYFDISGVGQPPRLWRIVPVP